MEALFIGYQYKPLLMLTWRNGRYTVTLGGRVMDNTSSFYKQIGENIRVKRKERGLSQEGLAKAIGLKRPSMSNIEKGRQNILLHTFCDIIEALDIKTDALLPERGRPQPANMPDLTSYSKGVREFVEAAIKPGKKEGSHGHQKTSD
jgi:transcriptional regulator with XRE-family HTH domain